jgi:site-specific recombinase XerC
MLKGQQKRIVTLGQNQKHIWLARYIQVRDESTTSAAAVKF